MSNQLDTQFQQCTRCVMDTTAVDIVFDRNGVCNYCRDFIAQASVVIFENSEKRRLRLEDLVNEVRESGKGKPYDCIVGVSGGVDSSWTLVEAKRLGLRPLAVHMDNGWNSELAQHNIANLIQRLGVDLYTHVIDWEEYRALMQAFFDADVVDVELLYDNAMLAVNYAMASRYGIRYILSGSNQATEGMRIPETWNWFKYDKRNIKALAQRSGIERLSTFPAIGTVGFLKHFILDRIKWIPFPDYLEYNKFEVLAALEKDHAYKRYPYKHYESIFTRFYQGYILPRKFGVDKRKLHLSTLVVTGQMSRNEALAGLDGIAYASQHDLDSDIKYFLKKMRWSDVQLTEYLSRPRVAHSKYPSEKKLWDFFARIYGMFK
jgi:N-acetyl sugar amidotransferase